jgi:hypothetical protein
MGSQFSGSRADREAKDLDPSKCPDIIIPEYAKKYRHSNKSS